MKWQQRILAYPLALVAILVSASFPTSALAQSKEVITFAAVTFSEAGRGDRLKAWVEQFNKSQNAIEVQPIALPFSSFAKTIFTQMGGGAGPDLVRFDQIDFYAAVEAKRILQLDEIINDRDYKFTAPDRYLKVGGKRYGTPFEISNYVLLYNPTLLKDRKAPANFDEFVAAAKALVAYLADRYQIPSDHLGAHDEFANGPTACPGKNFPAQAIFGTKHVAAR